jgi:hypothetical protein
LLQAQNAAGATVDSAGLAAVIVAAPRSLNLQVNESNPIFERYTVARPITDLVDLRSVQRQPILGGLISQYHRAA